MFVILHKKINYVCSCNFAAGILRKITEGVATVNKGGDVAKLSYNWLIKLCVTHFKFQNVTFNQY